MAGDEASAVDAPGGRVAFRFHARGLYLVMGRPEPGAPVPFQVRIDGRPPGAAHRGDVDAAGGGAVTDQRLYQRVRQPGPVTESMAKFESGTGWPSFTEAHPGALGTKRDFRLIWPRTEHHCARCGGHQGHVFDDGPPPTGKRYCSSRWSRDASRSRRCAREPRESRPERARREPAGRVRTSKDGGGLPVGSTGQCVTTRMFGTQP